MDKDEFDGEGGDFREKDAAKGVRDGGIDADKGEGGVIWSVFVELDLEFLGARSFSLMVHGGNEIGTLRKG